MEKSNSSDWQWVMQPLILLVYINLLWCSQRACEEIIMSIISQDCNSSLDTETGWIRYEGVLVLLQLLFTFWFIRKNSHSHVLMHIHVISGYQLILLIRPLPWQSDGFTSSLPLALNSCTSSAIISRVVGPFCFQTTNEPQQMRNAPVFVQIEPNRLYMKAPLMK